jgi:hypothetical protein
MRSIACIEAHERRKLMRGERREGAKTVYIFKLELGSLKSTPTPLSHSLLFWVTKLHTLLLFLSLFLEVLKDV